MPRIASKKAHRKEERGKGSSVVHKLLMMFGLAGLQNIWYFILVVPCGMGL